MTWCILRRAGSPPRTDVVLWEKCKSTLVHFAALENMYECLIGSQLDTYTLGLGCASTLYFGGLQIAEGQLGRQPRQSCCQPLSRNARAALHR